MSVKPTLGIIFPAEFISTNPLHTTDPDPPDPNPGLDPDPGTSPCTSSGTERAAAAEATVNPPGIVKEENGQ